jgi:hypothetical protein
MFYPNNFIIYCFLLFLMPTAVSFSQNREGEAECWEEEDIKPIYSKLDTSDQFIIKPGRLAAKRLIGYYQGNISPNSISRCPFFISCSNYAGLAVQKYGLLLGVAYFIDRNFYRENIASMKYYSFRENKSGNLKLDDSFYLLGGGSK